MKEYAKQLAGVTACFVCGIMLSACGGKEPVGLNIHSEPEGAHIIYKVTRYEAEEPAPWIYLGVTPYKGVTAIEADAFDAEDTISIKVLRNGYLDQLKEWDGEQFRDEYEAADEVIFWAPRMVKSMQ